MAKPRVLVFIDWYLPGYKAGGPVRSLANLVDHLRDRVDFHIVTRHTDYTETVGYPGILPNRWTALPGGERVWYASPEGTSRRVWKRLLREEQWDALYVNGLYSWWYNILPLWLSRGMGTRRVVAVRGMLASGALRHGTMKKLLFLALARILGLYRGVHFQATNEDEARDARVHVLRGGKVRVVPNLPRKVAGASVPVVKEPGTVKLVSVARIAVEKNTLFAIECLRQVKGTVQYDLYGPVYDEAYWAECELAIEALPAHVRVTRHDAVPPEEVPGVLANHHALFMPSAGENFGHAMLESLTAGRPLLISDRTPWRGLEAERAGWDLPLGRQEAFTQAVERLCGMDQGTFDQWSQGAFNRGTRYLGDTTAVEQSMKLFKP